MTDREFLDLAETLLHRVEAACDRINDDGLADIDNQRVGAMVTLTFADRSQIVINLQKPLHEVWLASRGAGQHYKFDSGVWRDSKVGSEFFADLARHASAQAGTPLRLD